MRLFIRVPNGPYRRHKLMFQSQYLMVIVTVAARRARPEVSKYELLSTPLWKLDTLTSPFGLHASMFPWTGWQSNYMSSSRWICVLLICSVSSSQWDTEKGQKYFKCHGFVTTKPKSLILGQTLDSQEVNTGNLAHFPYHLPPSYLLHVFTPSVKICTRNRFLTNAILACE